MNYKRLMAIVFIAAMLGMILPVLPSGAHIPCDAAFLVKVEGMTNWIEFAPEGFDPEAIILPELTYGYGKEFTVEVWILGVEDMFGYEFELTWTGDDYIELVGYTVEDVWPEQIQIKPDVAYELAFAADGYYPKPYKQVVSARPPSTGVSGDILLATLTFSIHTDICYCEGFATFEFNVENQKVSDSCTQEIEVCDVYYALAIFLAKAPDIMMKPNNETNSAIWPYDGKFTKEIWVSDVVKMKSLHFDLRWNKGPFGTNILELEQVEFDKQNLAHMVPVDPLPTAVSLDGEMSLFVDIKIKCTATPLRGTFRVMTLTFKKLDPWPCGRQPDYTYKQPHTWTPENATVEFYFYKGWFDVYCPDLCNIYFGEVMKSPLGTIIDGDTLFDGKGTDETYGVGEWTDAISGGGSVNLTTYAIGDVAAVGFKVPSIPLKDINKIFFKYYHNYPIGSLLPGPRLALGVNCTADDHILISESASSWATLPPREWEATQAPWWGQYNGWDAKVGELLKGNTTGIPAGTIGPFKVHVQYGSWADLKAAFLASDPQCNVTFVGLFMAAPTAAMGIGSAVVDLVNIEIIYPGAGGNYNMTYDLEPPCQTKKWYDKALYKLTQHKIVNLYTFIPVPGDLNRDGVVDITDVLIIAQMYGKTAFPAMYYDFSVPPDGDVDIFDIVVVTKNFGRTSP